MIVAAFALIFCISGIVWCVVGDHVIQRWQIKKAAKRKTAFEAAAIRQACEDYDRLAAEQQRERQNKIIDDVLARDYERRLSQQIAKPPAPDLPRLEDGARWIDLDA